MISLYILIALLTLCLIFILVIHIGYVKRVHRRFTSINLAYLLSMYTSAMNSIMLEDVPSQSIAAGSQTENPLVMNTIAQAITDYLQIWHWALSYMFTASRLPVIQITMSVSHQTTYLDDLGNQVAYAFQVTVQADGNIQTFPLVVSNQNVSRVVGKMTYHADQLEQLINNFMSKEERSKTA